MVSLKASPAVSAAEFIRPGWLNHQTKPLVANEVYHVDSTTDIRVNRTCRMLGSNLEGKRLWGDFNPFCLTLLFSCW